MDVNFFVTCIGDAVKSSSARNAVRLLEKLGCKVHFPVEQTCCGQPALNSGYYKVAAAGMKTNIRAFEDNDFPIVSLAGSCSHALMNYPLYLADEPEWAARAEKVSSRVQDITSFIVNTLGVESMGAKLKGRAVYHPSCSLTRKLGVVKEPLTLLSHVEGLELVDFEGQQRCCGFGGTFAVKMFEISGALVTEKVENILAVKPDYLIGADSSCLLNIGGRLHRVGAPVKVMHIVDVLMNA